MSFKIIMTMSVHKTVFHNTTPDLQDQDQDQDRFLCPTPNRRGQAMMLTSDETSVTYIGPKSRTERPRKTKIGREVTHVTCDSDDTTFKIKGQKSRSPGRFTHRSVRP